MLSARETSDCDLGGRRGKRRREKRKKKENTPKKPPTLAARRCFFSYRRSCKYFGRRGRVFRVNKATAAGGGDAPRGAGGSRLGEPSGARGTSQTPGLCHPSHRHTAQRRGSHGPPEPRRQEERQHTGIPLGTRRWKIGGTRRRDVRGLKGKSTPNFSPLATPDRVEGLPVSPRGHPGWRLGLAYSKRSASFSPEKRLLPGSPLALGIVQVPPAPPRTPGPPACPEDAATGAELPSPEPVPVPSGHGASRASWRLCGGALTGVPGREQGCRRRSVRCGIPGQELPGTGRTSQLPRAPQRFSGHEGCFPGLLSVPSHPS